MILAVLIFIIVLFLCEKILTFYVCSFMAYWQDRQLLQP